MDSRQTKTVYVTAILVISFFMSGCGEKQPQKTAKTAIDTGVTIGSLAEVLSPEFFHVQGYALVGQLKGTGSVECPPQIRTYLTQYILKQLPNENAEKFINSRDTAVVLVEGLMPTAFSKSRAFDVKLTALPGTQTTSLEGGRLYGAELRVAGSFGITIKVLAYVEGPIYIDKIDDAEPDKKKGYILAGGRVLDEYKIILNIREPDYLTANAVRNKLIERFGAGTAKAISPGRVELKVPPGYKEQKQRFISIVKAINFGETPETSKARINELVRKLVVSPEKNSTEIALESIGNTSLDKLGILLNSSNEEVRLRAARCMLNLGSDASLDTLREIALDKNSNYRVEALEAITAGAKRNDAAVISRRLLRDKNFDIRIAAYEQLRRIDDLAIIQDFVAEDFYLEQVSLTGRKSIFVSRSGRPRIAIFGGPIYCREDTFIQSADGNITINALPGQNYVSVIRKIPLRPDIPPISLKSSFALTDIILTLGETPVKKPGQGRPGLGVSYAELIALLKQMVDKGAIEAEFRAGALPKIGLKK